MDFGSIGGTDRNLMYGDTIVLSIFFSEFVSALGYRPESLYLTLGKENPESLD